MALYKAETLEKMGEIYHKLLWIRNKATGNDPYTRTSDIFPFKCFVMVLPSAMSIGIPERLNREITDMMEGIDVDDVEKLMVTPVPLELRIHWYKGFQRIYAASLV